MSYAEQMKEAIKEAIEREYGKLNDFGCYSGETERWLSTERLFDVVSNAVDENDWLFDEQE